VPQNNSAVEITVKGFLFKAALRNRKKDQSEIF
jgi:hypothetical protein